MRTSLEEVKRLGLEANAILSDVPLHDVTVVDLHGGGAGRTLSDVRALARASDLPAANPLVRALFSLRWFLGRLFRWDAPEGRRAPSYLDRITEDMRKRSVVAPGSPDGPFRLLYLFERESLAEIQNATVHAFLSTALIETDFGYRLYWAVYVQPVSWLTPLYMAVIEPFRRFIVYPALLRRLRKAWEARYANKRPGDGEHGQTNRG